MRGDITFGYFCKTEIILNFLFFMFLPCSMLLWSNTTSCNNCPNFWNVSVRRYSRTLLRQSSIVLRGLPSNIHTFRLFFWRSNHSHPLIRYDTPSIRLLQLSQRKMTVPLMLSHVNSRDNGTKAMRLRWVISSG